MSGVPLRARPSPQPDAVTALWAQVRGLKADLADREAQIRILESQLADLRALKLGTPIPRFGDPAVKLTRVEARLLGCLVLHAPEFVSRHALELAMYFDTGSARSENCLSVHIAKLRRKFKRQRKPLTIECQSGFGYSLQGWAS